MRAGRRSRSITVVVAAVLAAVAAGAFMYRSEPGARAGERTLPRFPTDGPWRYKVEYLGITCGHMTLESRREDYQGRPAYHVIMTARNSKFFNRIYRVDGRIESWVDAETLSSLAYISDISEKKRRKIRSYRVERERGVVVAERDGEATELAYEGGAALDPLAFVFRGRVLAGAPGSSFSLTLLTDKGALETVSKVTGERTVRTHEGKRDLIEIQPMTADGEMFSRKGEFAYWVDPGPERTLHKLDFKLGFGRLVASLEGPASGEEDRRAMAGDPDEED